MDSDSFDDVIAGLELDMPDTTATDMILFLGNVINHLEEGVRCLIGSDNADRASRFALWGLNLRTLEPAHVNMLITLELHALAILSMDYLDESGADVSLHELAKGILDSHEVYRDLNNNNVESFWGTYLDNVVPILESSEEMGEEFRSLIKAFWDVSDMQSKFILALEAADLVYELITFLQGQYYAHMTPHEVWSHFITNFRLHHTEAVEEGPKDEQ